MLSVLCDFLKWTQYFIIMNSTYGFKVRNQKISTMNTSQMRIKRMSALSCKVTRMDRGHFVALTPKDHLWIRIRTAMNYWNKGYHAYILNIFLQCGSKFLTIFAVFNSLLELIFTFKIRKKILLNVYINSRLINVVR